MADDTKAVHQLPDGKQANDPVTFGDLVSMKLIETIPAPEKPADKTTEKPANG